MAEPAWKSAPIVKDNEPAWKSAPVVGGQTISTPKTAEGSYAKPINPYTGISGGGYRPPSRKAKLEVMGVDTEAEGGGFKARLAEDLGDERDVRGALAEQFGVSAADLEIIDTQAAGRIFRNPETGMLEPLDKPGLDKGDWADLVAEAPVVAGELIGAAIGAAGTRSAAGGATGRVAGGQAVKKTLGPLVKMIIGASAGAGAGRASLETAASAEGVTDKDAAEIALESGVEAGLAAAAGAVPGIGEGVSLVARPQARAVRRMSRGGITSDQLARGRQALAETEAETGAEFSAGQRLAAADEPELAARVRADETGLQNTGEVERRRTQREAQSGIMADVRPQENVDPAIVGANIRQTGVRQAKSDIAQVEADTNAVVTELEKTINNISGTERAEGGKRIRDALEKGRDQVFENLKKGYDEILSGIPENTNVDMKDLRKMAKKWSDRMAKQPLPSLAPEDKKVVEDALTAGLKIENDTVIGDIGSELGAVRDTASLLKSSIRILEDRPELAPIKQKRMLKDFVTELEAARDKAISSLDEDAAEALRQQDAAYRVAKDRIDRALVGKIIQRKKGNPRVKADDVLGGVLAKEEDVVELMRLGAEYPELNAVNDIRESIFGKYQDEVVNGNYKHDSWMSRYRDKIRHVLTPEEMKRLEDAGSAEKLIKLRERQRKDAVKELKKKFNYKLDNMDAWSVVELGAGDPGKVRQIKEILKDAPDLWRSYKNVRKGQLSSDILTPKGELSLSKLSKYTAENSKERRELVTTLGGDYVKNLEKLKNIVRAQQGVGTKGQRETTGAGRDSVDLARGFFFGPLSHEGLMIRLGRKAVEHATERAAQRLLSNPDILEEAIRWHEGRLPRQQAQALFSALGLPLLAEGASNIREVEKNGE